MSGFVKHIRLAQLLLWGLVIAMNVAVWSTDDRIIDAHSEMQRIVERWVRMGEEDFLSSYLIERETETVSELLVEVDGTVTDRGTTYEVQQLFLIEPTWTLVPKERVSESEPEVLRERLDGTPVSEACDPGVTRELDEHDWFRDAVGLKSRLRSPETIGEYMELHDAMIRSIEVRTVRADALEAYAAIRYVKAGVGIVTGDGVGMSIRAVDYEGGAESGLPACVLLRSSTDGIFANSVKPSHAVAVGVLDLESLAATGQVADDFRGVVVVIGLRFEEVGLSWTGHEALGGSTPRKFEEEYPATMDFMNRFNMRSDLGIESVKQLLQELMRLPRASLPFIDVSVQVYLIPVVGFVMLLGLQVYVYMARRTLFELSRDRWDSSWREEAWIQTFKCPVWLKWMIQEWSGPLGMGALFIGLRNPWGNVRTEGWLLAVSAVVLAGAVLIAVFDSRLGIALEKDQGDNRMRQPCRDRRRGASDEDLEID